MRLISTTTAAMCDCAGGLLLLAFLGFLGLIIICTGMDRIEGRVYSIQKEAECLKKKVDGLNNALELNKAEAKEKKVEEVIVVELDKQNRLRIEGGKVIVEDKHALDSGEGGEKEEVKFNQQRTSFLRVRRPIINGRKN